MMCKVSLAAANHGPILDWIAAIRRSAASVPSGDIEPVRDAWVASGVRIRLPGFRIKSADRKTSSFDLWLQRGRLLSPFQPDPGFLRVFVYLRRDLPPGEAEAVVQATGFETPRTKRLSFSYIPIADEADQVNDEPGNWRSKFFVWTQLGFWCSESCFELRKDLFRKADFEARQGNLERLELLSEESRLALARSRFIERLSQLWTALGPTAPEYLESRNGLLDAKKYADSFTDHVGRDLELAHDEFRARYIYGCEIIDVPRFRTDATAWRLFVNSFLRQIHLEWVKARSQSRVFQHIFAALESESALDEAFEDPARLETLLRSNWREAIEDDNCEPTTVGNYTDAYHRD